MASKNNFFNRGLNLIADYQFNNNLIDDVRGNNLTGVNVTFANDRAVFDGFNSLSYVSDNSNLFAFTNGFNDLPFKIELSVQFDAFNRVQFLVAKRKEPSQFCEWQINFNNADNSINVVLFSGGINTNRIKKTCVITPNTNIIYNIVVTYNGNGLDGLNINVNGVDGAISDEIGTYVGMTKEQSRLDVGNWQPSNATRFQGKIDYLKIYK